jgi:hypothetical protein
MSRISLADYLAKGREEVCVVQDETVSSPTNHEAQATTVSRRRVRRVETSGSEDDVIVLDESPHRLRGKVEEKPPYRPFSARARRRTATSPQKEDKNTRDKPSEPGEETDKEVDEWNEAEGEEYKGSTKRSKKSRKGDAEENAHGEEEKDKPARKRSRKKTSSSKRTGSKTEDEEPRWVVCPNIRIFLSTVNVSLQFTLSWHSGRKPDENSRYSTSSKSKNGILQFFTVAPSQQSSQARIDTAQEDLGETGPCLCRCEEQECRQELKSSLLKHHIVNISPMLVVWRAGPRSTQGSCSSSQAPGSSQFAVPRKPARLQMTASSSQELEHGIPSMGKSRSSDAPKEEGIKEMWVDKHAPSSLDTLCMHKKKVHALQEWLTLCYDKLSRGESMCQRVLVFRGPSGAGKTAAVRVVAQSLGFHLVGC